MTIRERLADLISGGALSRERWTTKSCDNAFLMEYDAHTETSERATMMELALAKIAACETQNANATVRRMAKIAKEALK